MRRKRDIYIAIMVAEAKGTGLNLSFEELQELTMDDAINMRASNSLSEAEFARVADEGWGVIDPSKDRIAGNVPISPERRG